MFWKDLIVNSWKKQHKTAKINSFGQQILPISKKSFRNLYFVISSYFAK
jgi:hypothetical protein